MELSVSNETSLDLVLVVNNQSIQALAAHTLTIVSASELPPLPWAAEVQLPSGRSLIAAVARAGDVWSRAIPNGGTEMHGIGTRVDLSCGRIDLYTGPPLMGPMPGPGSPGDCDP